MKKYIYTALVSAAFMFLGAGCNLMTPKAVDCGSDNACAEKILTECKKGNFRILTGLEQVDKNSPKYAVLGKAGAGCDVTWEFVNAPEILSGSMKCNIPENITKEKEPIKAMGDYIMESKFSTCSGELYDKLNTPASEMPELSAEGRQCGDNNICAEILIRTCQKGKFLTSLPDGSEFEFWLVNSSATGCFADVKATKNSDQSLIGKSMRCIMSPAPTDMNGVRSFIIGILNDKTNPGGPCSGELTATLRGTAQNLSGTQLPPANLPKITPPKTTGGIDCGKYGGVNGYNSDVSKCIYDLLKNCKQGTFIQDTYVGMAGSEIKVNVQGRTDSKCLGTVKYTKYSDPALVGPEMTCDVSYQDINRSVYTKWRIIDPSYKVLGALCEGPLFNLLNP